MIIVRDDNCGAARISARYITAVNRDVGRTRLRDGFQDYTAKTVERSDYLPESVVRASSSPRLRKPEPDAGWGWRWLRSLDE